jgi:hypothetical protein
MRELAYGIGLESSFWRFDGRTHVGRLQGPLEDSDCMVLSSDIVETFRAAVIMSIPQTLLFN